MLQSKLERCGGSCETCGGCGTAQVLPTAYPAPVPPFHPPTPLSKVTGDEPFLHNAHLLVSASCGPFACGDFHKRFIRKRVTLIVCPNDRTVDCVAQLSAILTRNPILTLTVVRMESSCCDGLEAAAREALRLCEKFIPWQVVTLGADGSVVE